ncbi:MAG: hypothetical protein Q8L54_04125 [Devosia sp.]|nr:hypothetical protein [Devosia sp.]
MAILPTVKPKKKIAQKQLELRGQLFPHITDAHLWHRKTHDGYASVPRTMPLIMSILDDLAGQPVGGAYLELWCRSFDEAFVTLAKPREIAFHSGFGGQRGEATWRQRLKALAELGFIELVAGPSGPCSYALILNPYLVIRRLHSTKMTGLREDKFNALLERAGEIGASDMNLPNPWAPPPPPPPMAAPLAVAGAPLVPPV